MATKRLGWKEVLREVLKTQPGDYYFHVPNYNVGVKLFHGLVFSVVGFVFSLASIVVRHSSHGAALGTFLLGVCILGSGLYYILSAYRPFRSAFFRRGVVKVRLEHFKFAIYRHEGLGRLTKEVVDIDSVGYKIFTNHLVLEKDGKRLRLYN